MQLNVAICLPQEADTVGLIRAAIANTLNLFGVTDECVDAIRLALSEACTNVIQHAASNDEYEVSLDVDDDRCIISVKDIGTGFDSSSLSGTMPDLASDRGRGVAIMRAVVDRVDFLSEPETGTIVRLTKALDVRPDGPIARLRRPSGRR